MKQQGVSLRTLAEQSLKVQGKPISEKTIQREVTRLRGMCRRGGLKMVDGKHTITVTRKAKLVPQEVAVKFLTATQLKHELKHPEQ